MADPKYHKYLLRARDFCEELIKTAYSDETPFFEPAWQLMDSVIQKWQEKPSTPLSSSDQWKSLPGTLGFGGTSQGLKTPLILETIISPIVYLCETRIDNPETQIPEVLEYYIASSKLEEKDKKKLKQGSFQNFLNDIIEIAKNTQRPGTMLLQRRYTPQELSNPNLEFDDTLEIAWRTNMPSIIFNDEEIQTLRSQESVFIVLLCLAAARKTGDGWVDRTMELRDPKGHRIADLRRTFDLVEIKAVGKGWGKEIIRSDSRGKLKLALHAGSISVDDSILNFRSRHEDFIDRLPKILDIQLQDFEDSRRQMPPNQAERERRKLQPGCRKLVRNLVLYKENMELFERSLKLLNRGGYNKKTYQHIIAAAQDVLSKAADLDVVHFPE